MRVLTAHITTYVAIHGTHGLSHVMAMCWLDKARWQHHRLIRDNYGM